MSTTMKSFVTLGLEGHMVSIEVDHYQSHPGMTIVGLADTAVQESRERVRSAMKNAGFHFPRGKVVVNLAPADLQKSGPVFDLPIALSLILLSQQRELEMNDAVFFGELALDGSLRPLQGILSLVDAAKQHGLKKVFVPQENADEASLIEGVEVFAVETLEQAYLMLIGQEALNPYQRGDDEKALQKVEVDFQMIQGQALAKQALVIAAAGGHNVLLSGAPGSGKTLMAKALVGILPSLDFQESLEVSKLYSLIGKFSETKRLMRSRPFRTVHHTASGTSLVGGGRNPRPGEISLAHRGVLFLDEMAEFPSHVLDLLRQPMEDRVITISRTLGTVCFPADFMVCAAMNPCPCGYFGLRLSKRVCTCSEFQRKRYTQKISGPLLDRFDLTCRVKPVSVDQLQNVQPQGRSSSELKSQVEKAREFQKLRWKGKALTNAEVSSSQLMREGCFEQGSLQTAQQAVERLSLSARSYYRLLKVSRTIADLVLSQQVTADHVLQALQYRTQLSAG